MTIKTMHCNYSVDWKDDDGDRGCCEIQQRFPSLGLRSLSSSGSNHTFVNKGGGEVATKQRGSFNINTVQHALYHNRTYFHHCSRQYGHCGNLLHLKSPFCSMTTNIFRFLLLECFDIW